jgi:hypothetical protein
MSPQKRTIIWIVLGALAITGCLLAVIFWLNALALVKTEAAAHAKREVKLKEQVRINKEVTQLRDSTTATLAGVGPVVLRAIKNKNELGAAQVRIVYAFLAYFKGEIEFAEHQLDAVEQDVREALDGDALEEGLASVRSTRSYLGNLRKIHDQFDAEARQALGRPEDRAGKEDRLEKAVREAFELADDALKRLIEEKEKEKEKKPKP